MSRKNIILIISAVVLLVILVSGAYFLISSKNKNVSNEQAANLQNQQNEQNELEKIDDSTINGNLFDLLKANRPIKCTFSSDDEEFSTSGVTYVSNNKIRGDFDIKMGDAEPTKNHIISDGDWIYMWSSAVSQGLKTKLSAQDIEATVDDASKNGELKALKEDMNYKCTDWDIDSSKFEVPTDIKFMDFTQTLEKVTEDKDSLCGACDYISDTDAKNSCLEQLGCN